MIKTEVKGGFNDVCSAVDAILISAQPNIVQIVEIIKGQWIILHTA